ncbi:hypothetical protein BOTBODRAFT_55652 [Botryobasidium botryosum FD-172 SS1]|uniref:Cation-transporting P-type ATPase N-terminal domain-containing protein n=1 Tax=Botryobasidium botryosum (strain FD-172 SS1) TaxID=930990 RepID=A0A067MRK1_BOTB1|nr:hypothetical protein BOTBODRAFT_55652 [Botryobasidium botryosum FD-172 SS1]
MSNPDRSRKSLDIEEGRVDEKAARLPNAVTIDPDVRFGLPLERHEHTTPAGLTRELSRGSRLSRARIPAEFRTLSIHVESLSAQQAQVEATRKVAVKELSSLEWHKITVEEALQRLTVSPATGLESSQASRRFAQYGKNQISPPPNNLHRKILEWVFGGFGSLLLAASIVCFISWKPLGDPPQASNLALAVVLLIVLLLQAFFNAWQDFSTSRVMSSISSLLPSDVLVLRDSTQTTLPAVSLVPGDLVYITLGQKLPADMRIIEASSDLRFDRSILTGESEPVAATLNMTDDNFLETKNIALQGTHCIGGSGIGLVVQTGDLTVFGRIAKLSSSGQTRLTTLQRELLRFVLIIASLATVIAILIVVLWAAWLRRSHPDYINVPSLLIDVVSVMVAFIPEGLPVAVTISLAKVANTLSSHKVLCKSLSIVETLGAVNVLCSDKTGTLTQNRMTVEDIAILDATFDATDLRSQCRNPSTPRESLENIQQLGVIAGICNAATFDPTTVNEPLALRKILGDATDSAILRFAESQMPVEEGRALWSEVFKMNFNSKTKFMLKLSKLSTETRSAGARPAPIASWDGFEEDDFLLTVKGAPDVLYQRCSSVLDPAGGPPVPLTDDTMRRIVGVQEAWAAQGRRVLLLARRVISRDRFSKEIPVESQEFADLVNEFNADLTIVGLVGLIDPLKEDIVHTVSVCRGAGIRFFVVTGDHPLTSVAIAGQAGIISNPSAIHHVSDLPLHLDTPLAAKSKSASSEDLEPDNTEGRTYKSIVLTGPELMRLSDSQMEQLTHYDEIVFARTTPEQKLRIVHEFQRRGSIVAMTGDGVNDAPSLKAADVGIAMGSGSDVAREAADMVLLDSFSSIVIALEYGRLVYDNLKKTVLYLLPAGSFSELMPILLNVLFGLPQMLSNLQMIIICVATDVFPALSLCLEKPEIGLLTRKPRDVKTERLADWKLLCHAYFFLGVIESLCAMSMSFWYLQRKGVPFSELALGYGNWPSLTDEDLDTAQSIYFFTLVIMQWGNLLATRTRKLSIFQHLPSKNWYIFPAMLTALILAIFFSYVPFFQRTFLTRGISVEYYFLPMAFAACIVLLDEARKYWVRQNPSGILAKLAW